MFLLSFGAKMKYELQNIFHSGIYWKTEKRNVSSYYRRSRRLDGHHKRCTLEHSYISKSGKRHYHEARVQEVSGDSEQLPFHSIKNSKKSKISSQSSNSYSQDCIGKTKKSVTMLETVASNDKLLALPGSELSTLCSKLLSACPNIDDSAQKKLWEDSMKVAHHRLTSFNPSDVVLILHSVVHRLEIVRQALKGKQSNVDRKGDEKPYRHPAPTMDEVKSLLSLLPLEHSLIKAGISHLSKPERQFKLSITGLGLYLALLARLHIHDIKQMESIGMQLRQKLLEYHSQKPLTKIAFLNPSFVTICLSSFSQFKILHLPFFDTICSLLPYCTEDFSPSDLRKIIRNLNKIGYIPTQSIKKVVEHLSQRLENSLVQDRKKFLKQGFEVPPLSQYQFSTLIDTVLLCSIYDLPLKTFPELLLNTTIQLATTIPAPSLKRLTPDRIAFLFSFLAEPLQINQLESPTAIQFEDEITFPALIDAVISSIPYLSSDELIYVFNGCSLTESIPDLMIESLVDALIAKRIDLINGLPQHFVQLLTYCATLNISNPLILEMFDECIIASIRLLTEASIKAIHSSWIALNYDPPYLEKTTQQLNKIVEMQKKDSVCNNAPPPQYTQRAGITIIHYNNEIIVPQTLKDKISEANFKNTDISHPEKEQDTALYQEKHPLESVCDAIDSQTGTEYSDLIPIDHKMVGYTRDSHEAIRIRRVIQGKSTSGPFPCSSEEVVDVPLASRFKNYQSTTQTQSLASQSCSSILCDPDTDYDGRKKVSSTKHEKQFEGFASLNRSPLQNFKLPTLKASGQENSQSRSSTGGRKIPITRSSALLSDTWWEEARNKKLRRQYNQELVRSRLTQKYPRKSSNCDKLLLGVRDRLNRTPPTAEQCHSQFLRKRKLKLQKRREELENQPPSRNRNATKKKKHEDYERVKKAIMFPER